MKAITANESLPVNDKNCFQAANIEKPIASGQDILVRVNAVSVNPVDIKMRLKPKTVSTLDTILGWDASGVVVAAGEDVTLFNVGDTVFYAGDITRAGSNCEYQLVDQRIAGRKPEALNFEEAAAMPLTSITAWEALFERLGVEKSSRNKSEKSILIIGGAGGVGSIAIQLAKKIARLTTIATASRDESKTWCLEMGADHIINHHMDLADQLKQLGIQGCDYILCCNDTDQHFDNMTKAVKAQGRICSIVDNKSPLPMEKLKPKSASFSWEFMFTRSMFQTDDMVKQHQILSSIAQYIDQGVLQSTIRQTLSPINTSNLRMAHGIIEQGNMIGKLAIKDWQEQ